MIPSYLGSLKLALLAMIGDGVLIPDLERLLEAYCLILILSDELGVRGNEGYLRIVLLIKLKVQLLNNQR
jgi:hypothetical protein